MSKKSKDSIIVNLAEYDAILHLGLKVHAWAIAEPNWNNGGSVVRLEITCPEWALLRNKPLVRMLCQR